MKTRDELIERYGAPFTPERGYRAGALRAVYADMGTSLPDATAEEKALAESQHATTGAARAARSAVRLTVEEQRRTSFGGSSPESLISEKAALLLIAASKVAVDLTPLSAEAKRLVVGAK